MAVSVSCLFACKTHLRLSYTEFCTLLALQRVAFSTLGFWHKRGCVSYTSFLIYCLSWRPLLYDLRVVSNECGLQMALELFIKGEIYCL